MEYPFSAPAVKINRARKHLAEFESEIATYFATNPAKFDMKIDPMHPFLLVNIGFHIPGVPEELGAIIGDVIHNLRAALDLTACEIVKAAGQSDDDVHFPFCKDSADLEFMIKMKKFNRAGDEAVGLLRSLQPYRNGNAALRAIHDLDIRDKHQSLIQGARVSASPVIQMWEDDGCHNPRIIGDPTGASESKLLFAAGSGLDDREIVPTLHELVQLVDGIVEAFRALANRDTDSMSST